MKSFEHVRVGDVLRLERREVQIDPDTEYRLIGVYSFGKGIFHREPVAGIDLGEYRFFLIEPGDLVLSNIQAWEGAIALATERDQATVGTHRFLSYVPISDAIDTNWARWFFLSEPGMQLIRRAAPGTAVRNRTLAVKRFEDLVIPLPPIAMQRMVAAGLDRMRSSVERATILRSRHEVLASAFGAACASRPDISEEEKLRRGWARVQLDEVMRRAVDAVKVDPNDSYPNLGIYGFGRGLFAKPPIEGSNTSAKTLFRVRAGQFIYSRLFAFEGAYGFVPDAFDGFYVSNEFPSFDVDQARMDARWLASYLRTRERWTELAAASTGLGVRRQRVPVEAVLAYEVWLPPISQQHDMIRAINQLSNAHSARTAIDERIDSLVPAALNHEFAALT